MNFTREPIIETIITPKEGFKLIIRNSNGNSQEEHEVSSVEVVSFGKSFFFRSLEKPKPFLLPVSDYEVLEARETRSVLKKPKIEKSIKIGGGKAPPKGREKDIPIEDMEEEVVSQEHKKKSKGKASRRRRSAHKDENANVTTERVAPKTVDADAPLPTRRTLLPPPTSLISEQINRYKDFLAAEGALLPEELKEGGKVEELPRESSDDLSFLPKEKVISQVPPMFDETSHEEEKIVELEEEAPASPEAED